MKAVSKGVKDTRKEAGCRFYTLYADTENALKFVIVEEWESKAALDAHFEMPHFKVMGEELKDLLAAPSKIKIFEAQPL